MNSDKLDKYFKEQIGSLDSVSVPGANWNPQASWEKINQQSGGRRKLFFWWYLSGVASVVIIFFAFWFSGTYLSRNINALAEQNNEIPLESVNQASVNAAISTQSVTEIPVDKIEENVDEPIELEREPGSQQNQVLKNKRKSYAQVYQLDYLPDGLLLNESEIQFKIPRLLKPDSRNSSKQKIAIAFNRTYVIRRNNKEAGMDEKTGKELTLRLDLAMNSEEYPPSGILSNRRK